MVEYFEKGRNKDHNDMRNLYLSHENIPLFTNSVVHTKIFEDIWISIRKFKSQKS